MGEYGDPAAGCASPALDGVTAKDGRRVHLIPPTIAIDTPSDGEKLVFERLAADTAHPEWTVLHSLDIAHHRRQMEGEIDFLVIAPGLGVLVLEVKGCKRLRREHGLWYLGSNVAGEERGPFKQASEAMHSLRERLAKHRPDLEGVLFQSAVCFPFLTFDETSEEWHPWQVVDKTKLDARPIGDCLTSTLRQARQRAVELRKAWFDQDAGEPDTGHCEELVRVLRPDFEFFEAPKARARRTDEEIRNYTEQQFAALDYMRRMPRVVFDGPAGTGKTLLALEAARRSHAAGRSVLLLCFNRPLGAWLQDQAQGLVRPDGAPTVIVRTIHQHMTELARHTVKGSPADGQRYWDEALPEAACDRLLENWDALPKRGHDVSSAAPVSSSLGIFDELIVDEAQDVLRECFRDVLELSLTGGLAEGTWRMFGDFAWQTIYDDTVSLEAFCTRGGGCTVFPLDENCRNTPRVADLACVAGHVEPGYRKVLRPDDGVHPEIHFYSDDDDQRLQLIAALEALRDSGFTGPKVAVLSRRADARAAAARLSEPPWCDRLEQLIDEQTPAGRMNLRTGKTHYSSIYRFKGLEARAVVLTDIDQLSAPLDRSLVYVGATRATHRLVVLAHERLRAEFERVP
jgi:hypothetical protein